MVAVSKSTTIGILLLLLLTTSAARAQSGQSLFGDFRVDDSKVEGLKPTAFEIILYAEAGAILGRQPVSNNSSYRFNNLGAGNYILVVECEGVEVTRIRVDMRSPLLGDFRQDIEFEWKATGETRSKPVTISAADIYEHKGANRELFAKAQQEADHKRYDRSAELLGRVVKNDPGDLLAWTELGNIHFLLKSYPESENDYLRALDLHPKLFLALLNLGRLEVSQQKYPMAVDVLTRAVEVKPESAEANYLLGESYLQIKKGSLAVPYLNEAIRLDPAGMAEVHLRLATLYDKAGMKDKAAHEYEEFIKQKPDYPDRKRLEKYIADNKR
jgi:tetratricopeptide (TPR) repeat protein